MKNGYTHSHILLDRSGSMESIKDDVIGGFNSLIENQRKDTGKFTLSLTQFDDQYEPIYSFVDIQKVENLTHSTFKPRGSTAYLDAIGRTIRELGDSLSKMPEAERPEKVLVVVITDGMENASVEYTAEVVKKMIEHQTNIYNWSFSFIGSNIDAIEVGKSLGISAKASATYDSSPASVSNVFSAFSASLSTYRSTSPDTKFAINTGEIENENK